MVAFSKAMDHALKVYHSPVYHFIIGIVSSSTLLILIPQASNKESISYAGANFITLDSCTCSVCPGSIVGTLDEQIRGKI